MSEDVKCPYCGEWQEINHDDGYGYSENEVFEQECWNCDKVFIYTTTICFYYDAEKAPCKNGEPHKFKPIHAHPKEYAVGRYRCECCDEEYFNEEENKKWREENEDN